MFTYLKQYNVNNLVTRTLKSTPMVNVTQLTRRGKRIASQKIH